MEKQGDATRFATEFLMGGVSAAVSKTAAAPIERIKLLMQNEAAMLKSGRLDRPYNGIIDCYKRTVAKEGYLSLWRGNMANIYRYFPTQALNFAFKDQIKRLFAVPRNASYMKQTTSNIAAGGLAGAASLTIVYSLDFARTRLAADLKAGSGKRQFEGLPDVYRKTIQTDGIQGLYRGFGVSLVGIVIYRGLYFGLYDSLKPVVHKQLKQYGDNPWAVGLSSFVLGWGVTTAAGLASYPLDTVRRRMMMTSGEQVKYKSAFNAFAEIVKHDGVKALFNGAGANIIRAVAGAGALAGYDQFQLIAFGKAYSGGSG